jgi:DnaK suppressor protein
MIPLVLDSRRRLEERRVVIERELLETDAALARLERDLYGRCEVCGGAIGRQRLLALPLARYCLDCACTGA